MPNPVPAVISATSRRLGNATLIRRMLQLAWAYRADCVRVLLIQLVLLTMGVTGLSLTGVGIDYIRHKLGQTSSPRLPFGGHLPSDWPAVQVLGLLGGAILVLALTRALMNYSYAVSVNDFLQQRLVLDLRGSLYKKLQRLSLRFFDANTTGSIITRVMGDVKSVRTFLEQVLIQCVIMAVSLTLYAAYMLHLHTGLTLACLVSTPFMFLASLRFSRSIQPAYARNRVLVDRMVQTFAESVLGMAVTKGFARENEDRQRFESANGACLAQQQGIYWRLSIFSPFIGFLTRVNMIVLLAYGGWLTLQGELPLGTGLIIFAGLLEQFSGQVANLANLVNGVQQSLIGARRVFEVLDAPIEIQSAPNAERRSRLQGRVRFQGVGFHYGKAPVLREINLEVAPGSRVAILGPTGAGKTVLLGLIPRFYDVTAGRLMIDGIDVRRLRLEDLRRNIGIVFQESFLFSNTIAANIAFGHPEATPAQIEAAAKIAAAHDFIMRLPKRYATVLGEGGNTLSGGQRQRLAIARAILLEPPLLLLDDPTAAVDSETEREILDAIDRAMAGRTSFIVAHRISTLRRADLILVMDQGRIIGRGTHHELLRSCAAYRSVAELQLGDTPPSGSHLAPTAA